jgi:hypothetical protein
MFVKAECKIFLKYSKNELNIHLCLSVYIYMHFNTMKLKW